MPRRRRGGDALLDEPDELDELDAAWAAARAGALGPDREEERGRGGPNRTIPVKE